MDRIYAGETVDVNKGRYTFSAVGVVVGLLCIAILFCIDVFGPSSYSGSGSGRLMADGTVVVLTSNQPLLPLVARVAFFAFLVPLVCGVAGVFRKEHTLLVLASVALGLAPILIYTLGVLLSSLLYFAVGVPALVLWAFRRMAKT